MNICVYASTPYASICMDYILNSVHVYYDIWPGYIETRLDLCRETHEYLHNCVQASTPYTSTMIYGLDIGRDTPRYI